MGNGEGHTAFILLRSHVLTQHTQRPICAADSLKVCCTSSHRGSCYDDGAFLFVDTAGCGDVQLAERRIGRYAARASFAGQKYLSLRPLAGNPMLGRVAPVAPWLFALQLPTRAWSQPHDRFLGSGFNKIHGICCCLVPGRASTVPSLPQWLPSTTDSDDNNTACPSAAAPSHAPTVLIASSLSDCCPPSPSLVSAQLAPWS